LNSQLKVFSGSSNPDLSAKVAKELGIELGSVSIKRFSDQEIWVKYNENIRGADVFIVQATNPPAENILELLIMIDAASRASARRITAVIPYFGYARQDRKDQPRVALTSKLIATLLTSSGVDRVITMDLHASQIQGFFDIPMDHLYGSYVFAEYFRRKAIAELVVASPDIGSLRVTGAYAQRRRARLALVDKRRPKPNEVEVLNVIGEVKNKNVLFVDDMIDTAGTLTSAAEAMKAHGANDIYVACTHAILSGKAIERITNSSIKEMTVTDSIKIEEDKKIPKLRILTVSSLFAQAIDRIHNEKSISILFDVEK